MLVIVVHLQNEEAQSIVEIALLSSSNRSAAVEV